MTNPWSDTRPGKHRLNKPRDERQHSPCRRCYADCTSDQTTATLTFTCTNCGHTHTSSRGDSIRHTTFLARYTTGSEPNR